MNPFMFVYLIAAGLSTTSDASALGRLFTTEQERAQLDRPQILPAQDEPELSESEQSPAPKAATIRVDGFVKTPQRNVIWLDGAIHRPVGGQPNPVRARLSGTSRVIVDTQKLSVPLRPGQEANLQTRKIRDVIEPEDRIAETAGFSEGRADE